MGKEKRAACSGLFDPPASRHRWIMDKVAKMVPVPVFKKIESMQTEKDREFLFKKWQNLCERVGATGPTAETFNTIFQTYLEPDRRYHGISHLKTCLNEFELIRERAENPAAIEMALWFHDIVHVPSRKESPRDNEAESAQLAKEKLKEMGLDNEFIEEVGSLIMATKHSKPVEDKDEQFMADIDLVILGRSERLFDIYEGQVREEYSWAPEDAFRQKRAELLSLFFPPYRENVYQSEFFRQRYEEQARKNLQASIQKLTS
jgi:predicted metal-dependent HD superfamily phosphohydrolase